MYTATLRLMLAVDGDGEAEAVLLSLTGAGLARPCSLSQDLSSGGLARIGEARTACEKAARLFEQTAHRSAIVEAS